jgi:hypothetical protein
LTIRQIYFILKTKSQPPTIQKAREDDHMPTNEKEINCYLFDQLSILEEIEEVATKTNDTEVLKTVEKLRKRVERKLYQNPSLNKW